MQRRYWWLAGAAALAVVAVYLLYPRAAEPVTNYPSQGTDIIAFGDSLVEGVGSTPGNDFVSLLSQRLEQPIINLGVPGDTTASGLARVSALDAYSPKVVLLLLGGNDYLKRVPEEETFNNLAELIEDIQGRGAVVLLLGVRGGLLSDHFDEKYKALSERYHTAYVSNVLEGLVGEPQYMYDQIHPNDLGYARIVWRVEPVLRTLIIP